MTDQELVQRYNYATFEPENFEPWMRFDQSPPLGAPAPDFPLWRLADHGATSLSAVWGAHRYTIIEFGSFT